jgi:hypothetical protein
MGNVTRPGFLFVFLEEVDWNIGSWKVAVSVRGFGRWNLESMAVVGMANGEMG